MRLTQESKDDSSMASQVKVPAHDDGLDDNKASFVDSLRKKSLRNSGLIALVGNASLFASGLMSGRHTESAAAVTYAASAGILAKYGNPKTERQLELLNYKLVNYLKRQGTVIPQGSRLQASALTQKGGLIDSIEEFLYTNPAEVANALWSIGGAKFMYSGIKHRSGYDMAAGALVISGILTSLLVPERPAQHDNDKTESLPMQAWHWVQEKPLRTAGIMYGTNNVLMGMSALKQRTIDPHSKGYMLKFLTSGLFLMSNVFLAMSSKKNVGNIAVNSKALNRLEETIAEVIRAQPKEVQHVLTHQVAGFLCSQPGVCVSTDAMVKAIESKLHRPMHDSAHPLEKCELGWQHRVQECGVSASSKESPGAL